MNMYGNKEIFAILLHKDEYAYQMEMYVNGRELLLFKLNGETYHFRWKSLNDIVEWFNENLDNIMHADVFPVEVDGNSAVELYKKSLDMEFEDDEMDETLQKWMFKHSWFSAREGAFLADVFFRRINDMIEISWNNKDTFKIEKVTFLNPIGCGYVECDLFKKTINEFIDGYRKKSLLGELSK